jgi:Protein of unknown function (DUF3574)
MRDVSMTQRFGLPALAIVSAAVGAGLVTVYRAVPTPTAPVLACRMGSTSMARVELLFGLGRRDGGTISDADWAAFLDAEVTPRFPAGLTVLSGYGQWRGDTDALTKEASRVLLIWYAPAPDSEHKIEAIRAAYRERFSQDSVMRVDGRSCVLF